MNFAGSGQTQDDEPQERLTETSDADGRPVFVVGIGASAGGLEALIELLQHVPHEHVAFVVVQHLSPDHESLLPDILGKHCKLPVLTATDNAVVEPGRVYVLPPNAEIEILHGVLRLGPPALAHPKLPIDHFFISLAEDQAIAAVGVILSGTGSDGTAGLKAIKAAGGVTFAQEPASAKFAGMPQSALASGALDFCLTPQQIGQELTRLSTLAPAQRRASAPRLAAAHGEQLTKLFVLLRAEFGNDLSHYKPGTLERRIERRMALHRLKSFDDYVRYVHSTRSERQALYKDILIGVTSFFRDRTPFEVMKSQVFPRILEHKGDHNPIRVWVPACASGEEPYSLAICLMEFLEEHGVDTRVQLFGTDIDEEAIRYARAATYPQTNLLDVSEERLQRFFVKKGESYQVCRRIRELVVFSKHNVLKDTPFSRVDLVSCRNLLIYLKPSAQKRVVRTLHYALNASPTGFLLLGSSESVGDGLSLFSSVDRRSKLYLKKPMASLPGLETSFGLPVVGSRFTSRATTATRPTLTLQALADRRVLELHGPPGVVINDTLEIIQFRGHIGPYFNPAPGAASLHLLRVVRLELHIELQGAIQAAQTSGQRLTTDVSFHDNGQLCAVRLDVVPLEDTDANANCLLVLFQKLEPPTAMPVATDRRADADRAVLALRQRIQELDRELAATKEYLETTLEEKASTTEELQSANEELQSSNEELQSTNEELETAKEEMQSTNEELTTVNDELQSRMGELSQANDDLHNVLSGVDHVVIIASPELRIRRYTAAAARLFNLVAGDIGRSIGFLDTVLGTNQLGPKAASVLQGTAILDEELLATNQHWYSLRITPYRTVDDAIRGVVITLVDLDPSRRGAARLRAMRPPELHFLLIDDALALRWASEGFFERLPLSRSENSERQPATLVELPWAAPQLIEQVQQVLSLGHSFKDYDIRYRAGESEEMCIKVGGSRGPTAGGSDTALLTIQAVALRAADEAP